MRIVLKAWPYTSVDFLLGRARDCANEAMRPRAAPIDQAVEGVLSGIYQRHKESGFGREVDYTVCCRL